MNETTNLLSFPRETADRAERAELRRDLGAAGRKVWLAGLGLLGKVADLDAASQRWVDTLAERGRPLAERQRRAVDDLADRGSARLAGAGRRLEERARGGVAGALARLGVPSRGEIDGLSTRVAALHAKIDDIAAAQDRAAAHAVNSSQNEVTHGQHPHDR
jgi:poly(hydroxyalkanoate) granule-associated protein